MALVDSKKAIGAVSTLLQTQLSTPNTTAVTVDIGRPDISAETGGPKFNLFLYQIDMDGHLRNFPLDEGQMPPLWLVLHYILTAFDVDKNSDSILAHNLLGEGLLTLYELNFIEPSLNVASVDNPEPLKITFDSADSELLAKIMQGTDEKYRVSAAFQIRPVMIAPSESPRYALPVKTIGPPSAQGVVVLPSLGPKLETINPGKFVPGDTITLTGLDIGTEIEEIRLNNTTFPVVAAKTGEIKANIPVDTTLSPGSYPVRAVLKLAGDQEMSSNAVLGHLLPNLVSAAPGVLTNTGSNFYGDLTLTGDHLGGPNDSIYIGFYHNRSIALMLEATGTNNQTSLVVSVPIDDALPEGDYFIILRVNGEQATNAPQISWR